MKTTISKIIFLFTTLFLVAACCKDDDAINQGIASIYIEGNITNEEVVVQLANELGSATQNIYVVFSFVKVVIIL